MSDSLETGAQVTLRPFASSEDGAQEYLRPFDFQDDAQVYLRPFGYLHGSDARVAIDHGLARPLAGGPAAFMGVELVLRGRAGLARSFHDIRMLDALCDAVGPAARLALRRLSTPRPPLRLPGGRQLDFEKPRIMGILNVTPDSFSDGGLYATPDRALAHGRAMRDAGADLLDVGGESTRPGSDPVGIDEEQRRVLPVIRALAAEGVLLSIDSRNAATMTAAARAGAEILNDVSALGHDPQSLGAAKALGLPVILMHAQGDPKTMQDAPRYEHALLDVYDYLAGRVEQVMAATGLPRDQIVIDPGVGFGKGLDHNLDVLRGLGLFHAIGCPVLLGVSRKSFIGRMTESGPAGDRLPGSLAAGLRGILAGVQILRVHDVAETAQALAVWDKL